MSDNLYAEQVDSIADLNDSLRLLNKKVDRLSRDVDKEATIIHAHPVMFVLLLVGFFITMDFWANAAQATIHHFHPRGYLEYWEHIALAIISLGILIWVGNRSGVRIRMLGET